MSTTPTSPSPRPAAPRRVVDVEDSVFWAAIDEGRLVLARCRGCGTFYARRQACLVCGRNGSDVEWIQSPGRGVVRSFLVFDKVYHPYFADRVPYNVAVVRLDEGPDITTNVVDCPIERLRVGLPVRVVVGERDGQKIPQASALV